MNQHLAKLLRELAPTSQLGQISRAAARVLPHSTRSEPATIDAVASSYESELDYHDAGLRLPSARDAIVLIAGSEGAHHGSSQAVLEAFLTPLSEGLERVTCLGVALALAITRVPSIKNARPGQAHGSAPTARDRGGDQCEDDRRRVGL